MQRPETVLIPENAPAVPALPESERLATLDGVRGLAVALVFLGHSSSRGMSLAPWLNFDGLGVIGVYLFFVLSGYLLAVRYRAGQTYADYMIRRVFRIVPLYFLVLIGVFVAQQFVDMGVYLRIDGGWKGLAGHFAFIKGDRILWTMPTEFTFYLVLPLFVRLAERFGAWTLALIAAVYFSWYALIVYGQLGLPPLKFVGIQHPTQFVDIFLCGVLAAFWTKPLATAKERAQKPLPSRVVAIVFWSGFFATLALVGGNFLGFNRPWLSIRTCTIGYGLFFALMIASAARGNPWLDGILQSRLLCFMGKVGFSWYLLHYPVFQLINTCLPHSPPPVRFALAFAGSYVVSTLGYFAVEKPMIHLGYTVGRWWRRPRIAFAPETASSAIASSRRRRPLLTDSIRKLNAGL